MAFYRSGITPPTTGYRTARPTSVARLKAGPKKAKPHTVTTVPPVYGPPYGPPHPYGPPPYQPPPYQGPGVPPLPQFPPPGPNPSPSGPPKPRPQTTPNSRKRSYRYGLYRRRKVY